MARLRATEDNVMLRNEIYNLMEAASVLSKGLSFPRLLNHLKQHFDKEIEFKLTA